MIPYIPVSYFIFDLNWEYFLIEVGEYLWLHKNAWIGETFTRSENGIYKNLIYYMLAYLCGSILHCVTFKLERCPFGSSNNAWADTQSPKLFQKAWSIEHIQNSEISNEENSTWSWYTLESREYESITSSRIWKKSQVEIQ